MRLFRDMVAVLLILSWVSLFGFAIVANVIGGSISDGESSVMLWLLLPIFLLSAVLKITEPPGTGRRRR